MSQHLGGVFVLGASGEVGREVIKELVNKNIFSKIVVITRREIPKEDVPDTVEQKVVDFDKIDEYGDTFKDLEYGFCCLGTTRGKAGAAGFYKVDHDYVVNSAKVALANGCKHFSVVSSTGANAKSAFLYNETKGKMEADLQNLGFEKLIIYRPAMLDCDRREGRFAEKMAGYLLAPVNLLFPTRISVKTSILAKVMIYNASNTVNKEKVEMVLNPDLHRINGEIEHV